MGGDDGRAAGACQGSNIPQRNPLPDGRMPGGGGHRRQICLLFCPINDQPAIYQPEPRAMKFLPLAIISGLFLSSLHVSGAETDWIIPRTEHGHPDLQGLWHNTTQTPIERPVALGEQRAYTEAEV